MEAFTNTKTRTRKTKTRSAFSEYRKFLHRDSGSREKNQKRVTKTSSAAKKNLPLEWSLKMLVKNTKFVLEKHLAQLSKSSLLKKNCKKNLTHEKLTICIVLYMQDNLDPFLGKFAKIHRHTFFNGPFCVMRPNRQSVTLPRITKNKKALMPREILSPNAYCASVGPDRNRLSSSSSSPTRKLVVGVA